MLSTNMCVVYTYWGKIHRDPKASYHNQNLEIKGIFKDIDVNVEPLTFLKQNSILSSSLWLLDPKYLRIVQYILLSWIILRSGDIPMLIYYASSYILSALVVLLKPDPCYTDGFDRYSDTLITGIWQEEKTEHTLTLLVQILP